MEAFRLSALALTAALLTLAVKKQSPELALVLSLCACALAAAFLLGRLEPVLRLAERLAERGDLDPELTGALFRCLGLGLLTELSAAVCADAGQSALSKLVELGGGVLCLIACLPLLQAVLALIEELL
ncbi:MAG: stage III sporulation AC/AD family protein [Oscillospiraceae bacterium]|nr:stage III sporulation AC/AD family protein [Oscillospiraceae bacterium]MBR4193920.1 stage III sporulation AC/AD family protein [Oscillospiraceae bacterium]